MSNRWVILKHGISKDLNEEFHFDLLLEDGNFCRTWRLDNFPCLDGPSVEAVLLSPHKLYWLDRQESAVSGGRGWAQRMVKGKFYGCLPLNHNAAFSIQIKSLELSGMLELRNNCCQIRSDSAFNVI